MLKKINIFTITSLLSVTLVSAHIYSSGTMMVIEAHNGSSNSSDLVVEMHSSSTDQMVDRINRSSKREDIKGLQEMLVAHGYLKMPKGAVPGTYGNLTREAVKKYNITRKAKREFNATGTISTSTVKIKHTETKLRDLILDDIQIRIRLNSATDTMNRY